MAVMYQVTEENRRFGFTANDEDAYSADECWRSYNAAWREVDKLGDDWSLESEVAGFTY